MSIPLQTSRRHFLAATGTAFAGLAACGGELRPARTVASDPSCGPLAADPKGLLDLPQGFSYRVLSRLGDAMHDGGKVPDNADGMGCFALPGGRLALVLNHELTAAQDAGGSPTPGYDHLDNGKVLPGGTTTLILDARTFELQRQFRSLAGTIRNCAGGITPWGSWLTCEEDVTRAGQHVEKDHGWIFEVPAAATGMAYLTEDRDDGLLYRFVPRIGSKFAAGGKLQALAIDGMPDSRHRAARKFVPASWQFAGACFSPDGKALFVNLQSPTTTLAITGPWC